MITLAGHLAFDFLGFLKELPERNHGCRILDFGEYFGGGAANMSVAVKKMGEDSGLFTTVGSDFEGSDYEKYLKEVGVGIGHIIRRPEKTSRAWMYTDENGGMQCYFYWGSNEFLKEYEIPPELKKADIVHFVANRPEFVKKNVDGIKGKVSWDPSYDTYTFQKEDLLEVLPKVDYFFVNEHEYKLVSERIGKEEIEDFVDAVIVSEGALGCTVRTKDESFQVPAVKVDNVVDTVGAGDAHATGFLVAQQRGKELKESVKIGNVAASFVIQKKGAQPGLPTWEQIEEKLKELKE